MLPYAATVLAALSGRRRCARSPPSARSWLSWVPRMQLVGARVGEVGEHGQGERDEPDADIGLREPQQLWDLAPSPMS